MRLSENERKIIKEIISKIDSEAKIYLFGSRVDDAKRGGDIDLLVFSKVIAQKERRSIRVELLKLLGDQKIDLVVAVDASQPFVKIALAHGILL